MKFTGICRRLVILPILLLAWPLAATAHEATAKHEQPAGLRRDLESLDRRAAEKSGDGGRRAADVALADLGHIEGRVRHRDTGEPVDTRIRVYTQDGSLLSSTSSQQGAYDLGGLPPGEYWVVAYGRDELAGMIYGGVTCNPRVYSSDLDCPTSGAVPVRVQLDQVVTGIDFALEVGGVLTGRVFDARTGGRLNATGFLALWDETGREVHDDAYVDTEGFFQIEGLALGTYFASFDSPYYTPQFFDGVDCISGAASGRITGAVCLSSAQPIVVSLGAVHGPIDFPLRARGTLSGRVRDDLSGAGVAGARITLIHPESAGEYIDASSDSSGYFSFSGVPAVKYQVLVTHELYRSEYFDDVDARQGPAAARILTVEPGELTSIEVGLAPHGAIRARALEADSGEPLGCFSLRAIPLDLSADTEAFECDSEDGWQTLEGIPPGHYYVMVEGTYHAAHLYGRGSCTALQETGRCHLGLGTPVRVRSGEILDLGTFELEGKGDINWSVSFAETSPSWPLAARLRLFDEVGDEVRNLAVEGDHDFGLLRSLAPGDYRLVAEGAPHWESVAYPDAPCSRWYCNPALGEPLAVPPGTFGPWVSFDLEPIAPYTGCAPGETALCLNQGRYRVTAAWRDFAGASGAGTARALTADSGYFYFFSPNNLEVLVKVLNACDPLLGHHFWVYGAGLTNVQVELRVEDTLTGAVELYSNALGATFQPILDSSAFATCDAHLPQSAGETAIALAEDLAAPAREAGEALALPATEGTEYCQPDSQPLCLGGRFTVEASYRTAVGNQGSGAGARVTPDTGTFYFFDPANVELVVKILDACTSELPGYWVFASGLTDVEVELTITDRASGRSKIYHNELGPFAPILDLRSFPCN